MSSIHGIDLDNRPDQSDLLADMPSQPSVTALDESLTRLASLVTTLLDCPLALVILEGTSDPILVKRSGADTPTSHHVSSILASTLHDRMRAARRPLMIETMPVDAFRDTIATNYPDAQVTCLGLPLTLPTGHLIGSAWAIDGNFRPWSTPEAESFATLVEAMIAMIEQERYAADARRSLRAAIRERRQFDALLERLTDGFVAFDRDWTLRYINRQAATFLRASREEVLGKPLWVVWPGVQELDAFARVERAVAAERSDECVVWDPDHHAWLEVRVFPSRDGIAMFLRDITDRKRLEAELVAEHQQREAFLATASHELKTPLTTIKGIAQLLRRRVPAEERITSLIGRLQDQAERMERLIVELLDTSQIHQGYLALQPTLIDLAALVHEVTRRFEVSPLMRETHHVTVDAPEQLSGRWDRERLDQVITNLLSNALKYSPNGGEVRVELATIEEGARLRVIDHGVGMTPDIQARVFEPFKSGAGAIGAEGTGLGLYIAKQIIDRHYGQIEVTSEPDHGSTFTVRLPLETTMLPK